MSADCDGARPGRAVPRPLMTRTPSAASRVATSADCARASAFTRAWSRGASTDTGAARRAGPPRSRCPGPATVPAGAIGLGGGDERLGRHAVGQHAGAAEPVRVDHRDVRHRAGRPPGRPRSRPGRRRRSRCLACGWLTMPHSVASAIARWAILPTPGHRVRRAAGGSYACASVAMYAAYGSNMDPAQMADALPALALARHRLAGRLAADLRRRGHELGGRAAPPWSRMPPNEYSWCSTTSPRLDERVLDHWDGATLGLLPQAPGAGADPRR